MDKVVLQFIDGLMLFRYFVAIEHSDENLDFWKRCEEFKQLKSAGEWEKAAERALEIFDQHIATTAENEVKHFHSSEKFPNYILISFTAIKYLNKMIE